MDAPPYPWVFYREQEEETEEEEGEEEEGKESTERP